MKKTLLSTAALSVCVSASAITILTGPTFTPSAQAPLAGTLQLTTDVPSRISVQASDGESLWETGFYDYSTSHSVTLLGFHPNQTNQILVTVYDQSQNTSTATQPLTFVTAPLPANFPGSVVLQSDPSRMEPGYTLFIMQNRTAKVEYITLIDNDGQVVWYNGPFPQFGVADVRQLDDGNLFIVEPPPGNRFIEMNLLGQTVNTWSPPAQYPINLHEGLVTDHGTLLYLSDVTEKVPDFPSALPLHTGFTNSNPPLITASIDDNPVVELSFTNSALLNAWSPLSMLDPTRVTYLSGDAVTSFGVDNLHANAIVDSTNDNSIIVSLRDQNAVFKFDRPTGQLKWILGPPTGWGTAWQPYLLAPQGTPFEWNYGQHAPSITPQGTLLLYDDGPWRASPFVPPVYDPTNYSRAVEYSIDETNMQVSQVWDTTAADQDRLFTEVVGKAQWLPQVQNVLVTYGYVSYVNGIHPSPNPSAADATMVRLVEYTHDPVPQVVFDIAFWDYANTSATYRGYLCYRAERVPDLYPHPAEPVADLFITAEGQTPLLQFSGDPARDYTVQVSTDLLNWTDLGAPQQRDTVGEYYYYDYDANQDSSRFYRVVTR